MMMKAVGLSLSLGKDDETAVDSSAYQLFGKKAPTKIKADVQIIQTTKRIVEVCCCCIRQLLVMHPLWEPCEAFPAGQNADNFPRGWNSFDSFSWIISEEDILANAKVIANSLLAHGYKYVVVDFLRYRTNVDGSSVDSPGYDVIDEWGRLIPDPDRWPSSKGGQGFSEVANQVHYLGLKFKIHVMRGISAQAVNANTPILDITKNLFTLKHDCIFGDDLDIDEIRTVSEILKELDRPIVYSISPGTNATLP